MSAREEHPEARLGWALLVLCGLFRIDEVARLWTLEGGPTDACWRRSVGGADSTTERLFLRLALDTWNGQGGAHFAQALQSLDGDRLRLVARMLTALAFGTEGELVDEARRVVVDAEIAKGPPTVAPLVARRREPTGRAAQRAAAPPELGPLFHTVRK